MKHSGRSQIIRIAANYAQLFGSFLIGLFVVRLLLGLGESVYGVIAVLIAGTGLARLLREVLQTGLVPVLAAAWHPSDHGKDDRHFRSVYSAALVVAAAAALVTLLGFAVLDWALGFLDIPPELRRAASVFVWLRGIQSAVSVVASPPLTLLVVREKFIAHNALLLTERSFDLVAVLIALAWAGVAEPARAIVIFATVVCAGSVLLHLGAAAALTARSQRTRPGFGLINRTETRRLTASLGWNAAHSLAMNLHLRLDVVIMNAWFGLAAGMLFSLAGQAASYVRQLAMGLVVGVDALSARHRSRKEPEQLRRLARGQMTLQAAVVLPAAGALFIAAEELLGLWLRGRLEDPAASLPEIALFCRILLVGVIARSLSESWISTLTGTGNAKKLAPLVLAGAVLNPLLIFSAIAMVPGPEARLVPAISFAAIFVVIHLALIPRVTARLLEVRMRELFRPAALPAVAAAVAGAAAFGLHRSGAGAFQQLTAFLVVDTFVVGVFLYRHRGGTRPAPGE